MIKKFWQHDNAPLILAIILVAILYWALINTALPEMIVGGYVQ